MREALGFEFDYMYSIYYDKRLSQEEPNSN